MKALGLIIRPVLIFAIGYAYIRLMKKHSMGAANPFDFLITVMLGTVLAGPIVDRRIEITSLYAGVIVFLHIVASRLLIWRSVRQALAFKPTMLVREGQIDEAALRRERITIPHLLAELRIKGYPNIADIQYAILEETGEISVIPREEKRPIKPSDIGLKIPSTALPTVVILDGRIVESNLNPLGKGSDWSKSLLSSYGIHESMFEKISLASLDSSGRLHVDYYDQGAPLESPRVSAPEQKT